MATRTDTALSGTLVTLAAGLATAALATATLTAGRDLLTQGLHAGSLDQVVLVALTALGTAVAAWYALSAAALVVGGHSAGLLQWCARWGAPGLRRWAAAVLVAGSALGVAGPAAAAPTTAPDDLAWGTPAVSLTQDAPDESTTPALDAASSQPAAPTEHSGPEAPTEPSGPAVPVEPAAPDDPTPSDGPAATDALPGTATVTPGDSLWSIAAHHLGPGATAEEIQAEWPRWYEANRDHIGEDPDLIHPGLTLTPPDQSEQELR